MRKLIFFVPIALIGCTEERESTFAKYDEIVEAVYSSVVLEPEGTYAINATISGIVTDVQVNEGDSIAIGQTIYSIDNAAAKLNTESSELNYQYLLSNSFGNQSILNELKLELETAKSKLTTDSTNYMRYKALFNDNVVSKVELDNTLLLYEQSKNFVGTLKNRIARTKVELDNQVNQAKNARDLNQLKTMEYRINSLADGMVYQLLKEKGEFVTMQETIAVIGKKDSYKIKMQIDEVDIAKVKVGQKVVITLEAFKDKPMDAKVSKIAPKMNEKTQTFEVEATFVGMPEKLYMGLTGEGNIVIQEKRKTLVIPRAYLQEGNKVETDAGLVAVKVGLSNWEFIEILSGIDEKTKIYKPE
jgi:multidrug efflux pump subunit AcrA (membrane-fusion protein)